MAYSLQKQCIGNVRGTHSVQTNSNINSKQTATRTLKLIFFNAFRTERSVRPRSRQVTSYHRVGSPAHALEAAPAGGTAAPPPIGSAAQANAEIPSKNWLRGTPLSLCHGVTTVCSPEKFEQFRDDAKHHKKFKTSH